MEPSKSAPRRQTGLTVAIILMITSYALINGYQSVAMNRIVDAFHLTGGAQGIMSSMINVGCVLAMLLAPLLQGRMEKMAILLAASALTAASFFAIGWLGTLPALIGFSILLGIGNGLTDTECNAAMVDVHPDRSSVYLGVLHGVFGIGGLISPLLVAALLGVMTWQMTSVAMGGVTLLMAVPFALLAFVFCRGRLSSVPEQRLTVSAAADYLKKRRNLLLLVTCLLYSVTQSAIMAWIVRYMTLRFHTEALGAASLSAYWICVAVGRFIAPRLRVRPLKLFVYGMACFCVFLLVGVLGGSALLMCVMCGCIGLTTGHCIPVLIGESAVGYEGMTSLPTSTAFFFMCMARVLTPLLLGAVADGVSITVAMLLPVLAGALAAVFGVLTLRADDRAAR